MSKQDIEMIVGIGGIIAGLIGISYISEKRRQFTNMYKRTEETEKELKNIQEKLRETTYNLSKDIDIDVPKHVVDDAIRISVDKEVQKAIDMAVSHIRMDIGRQVSEEVSKVVSIESENITKRVTDKITDEVSKISSNGLAAVVRKEATERVISKFDGELDDILERYTNNLDNISKVYSSISKRFGDDAKSSGKDFKISVM